MHFKVGAKVGNMTFLFNWKDIKKTLTKHQFTKNQPLIEIWLFLPLIVN
jgi:hypothetical protein